MPPSNTMTNSFEPLIVLSEIYTVYKNSPGRGSAAVNLRIMSFSGLVSGFLTLLAYLRILKHIISKKLSLTQFLHQFNLVLVNILAKSCYFKARKQKTDF